ncbi:hypothetical protein DFJ73DRAFT_756115 [Zopfochytrium polystomum]|nr:hypothetical protein DFJ73DRAFT_756115 [Zopfochytrium polystomum]
MKVAAVFAFYAFVLGCLVLATTVGSANARAVGARLVDDGGAPSALPSKPSNGKIGPKAAAAAPAAAPDASGADDSAALADPLKSEMILHLLAALQLGGLMDKVIAEADAGGLAKFAEALPEDGPLGELKRVLAMIEPSKGGNQALNQLKQLSAASKA